MREKSPARAKRIVPRCDLLRVDRRWAWHYRTLVALRNHLVAEMSPDARAGEDETGRLDRAFIQALLAREADPLGEISAAIGRILHGEYGRCAATGKSIPAARLRSAPWVRYRGPSRRRTAVTPLAWSVGHALPAAARAPRGADAHFLPAAQ